MPIWMSRRLRLRQCLKRLQFSSRTLSTARDHERVEVRCGSGGHVAIDLWNMSKFSMHAPLLIHLPPFPPDPESKIPNIPDFLQSWPVASINYRWSRMPSLQWPNPCHDVGFAFTWLCDNLVPPAPHERDVYVYGSYLGASLAASLSLTESTLDERFNVKGLIAYNGVYNWTMFLPEHPQQKSIDMHQHLVTKEHHLHELNSMMRDLFNQPSHLFDPFASASLFFHEPGLHIPASFDEHASPVSDIITVLLGPSGRETSIVRLQPPLKSSHIFPPRYSTLTIPQALFLYDQPVFIQGERHTYKPQGHSFYAQADELADYMRRSLNRMHFRGRLLRDWGYDNWGTAVMDRIELLQLRQKTKNKQLCDEGAAKVVEWLEERA